MTTELPRGSGTKLQELITALDTGQPVAWMFELQGGIWRPGLVDALCETGDVFRAEAAIRRYAREKPQWFCHPGLCVWLRQHRPLLYLELLEPLHDEMYVRLRALLADDLGFSRYAAHLLDRGLAENPRSIMFTVAAAGLATNRKDRTAARTWWMRALELSREDTSPPRTLELSAKESPAKPRKSISVVLPKPEQERMHAKLACLSHPDL